MKPWSHLRDSCAVSDVALELTQDQLGFSTMTPVQSAAIPLFINRKDVLVQAATGSGKTLAYLIPCFEMLHGTKLAPHQVGALVILPTRELAMQVFDIIKESFSVYESKAMLLVGGSSHQDDKILYDACQGANVLVGTPGRIEAVMNGQIPGVVLDFKTLEVLVLDEADRLLDLGFEVSIKNIIRVLPKQRRTGLFSATLSPRVEALVAIGLRNPAKIEVKVKNTKSSSSDAIAIPDTLESFFLTVSLDSKVQVLIDFLLANKGNKFVVFVLTRACADYLSLILEGLVQKGYDLPKTFGLHGAMVQKKRSGAVENFIKCNEAILVCTDVAARGIDFPDVDWIVQYDPPQDPSFFVHRVGRTARAGKSGKAVVFLTELESPYQDILKLRKVPLSEISLSESCSRPVVRDIKTIALSDRAFMEKGQNAYVSYVRGYKEHLCNYIFQWKKLDYGKLATGLGLLYVWLSFPALFSFG